MELKNIYDADKFKKLTEEVQENNIYKNKKAPMDLIYNIIENGFLVTPTTLKELSLDTVGDALEIMKEYHYAHKLKDENPIHEMQMLSTAKAALDSFVSSQEFVGDEDFF